MERGGASWSRPRSASPCPLRDPTSRQQHTVQRSQSHKVAHTRVFHTKKISHHGDDRSRKASTATRIPQVMLTQDTSVHRQRGSSPSDHFRDDSADRKIRRSTRNNHARGATTVKGSGVFEQIMREVSITEEGDDAYGCRDTKDYLEVPKRHSTGKTPWGRSKDRQQRYSVT